MSAVYKTRSDQISIKLCSVLRFNEITVLPYSMEIPYSMDLPYSMEIKCKWRKSYWRLIAQKQSHYKTHLICKSNWNQKYVTIKA